MREAALYYRRWLRVAFRGTADRTALGAFLFSVAAGTAEHFDPRLSGVIDPKLWVVPFWIFAAYLLWRMLAAPFTIWKDDQRKLSTLQTMDDLKVKRRSLGRLLAQCEYLKLECGKAEPLNEQMMQEWLDRALKFLGEDLGEEYVHRFISNAGIAPLVLSVPTAPARNKEIWSVLHFRSVRLNQFLEEMA